ncbi:GNAT family N-acetyltransferase [Candidatus Micrarchaeota archaeon]|nr:GNAT family N-acetyltransferase [Candidatus Micrarchaeota archaeon]
MGSVLIRLIKSKSEFEQVLKIRHDTFVIGQKVPIELEVDGLDKEAEHFILFFEGTPAGCARIRYLEDTAKLERIAILEQYRGKGLGKELMRFLIRHCRQKPIREIVMHAQYYLLEFYRSFGFVPVGERFDDVGIEHIEMRLKTRMSGK